MLAITPVQWIGFGFVAFLIVFLMVTFFLSKNLTGDQRNTLKFLCSLCAAFAGGLIAGDALFKLDGKLGGADVAISGTAGFALFFVVWFFYGKATQRFPDGFHFSVPSGWTFKAVVEAIADQDGALVDFQGFEDSELSATLRAKQLRTADAEAAMRKVGHLTETPGTIRKYSVEFEDSTYTLKTD